jgi:hypothetical protein
VMSSMVAWVLVERACPSAIDDRAARLCVRAEAVVPCASADEMLCGFDLAGLPTPEEK